ncbi:MAG: adenylosuccinate lyase [Patiriisocius sp.]|jgi:adenylosuccinate lyase
MNSSPLEAIGPVDGRYQSKTKELSQYFSELGLIKYRLNTEVEYFIALCDLGLKQLPALKNDKIEALRSLVKNFSLKDAEEIKATEQITNHDVKAVEYFLKSRLKGINLDKYEEFIHFGLTSQDINNTAIPSSMKDALEHVYFPWLRDVIRLLNDKSVAWSDIPMLAKTHGQPASPTYLGKEIYVFVERLNLQFDQLKSIPMSAKFGGATGNFNAHQIAFPEIDWVDFANVFVNNTLGLSRSQTTTQIEHYDNLSAVFDAMSRINNILIDLSRDIWQYVSMEYFKQKIKKGEIGSSAMPHKVNPIDFENAEGNLGVANALLFHFKSKLPISRLQRDLTDSTVLRNIGIPMAHGLIAFKSIDKGLNKLLLNEAGISKDLNESWAVVAEAIQTVLRREGYPKPYEALKELTRTNSAITQGSIAAFIRTLDITDDVKTELLQITPFNFTGIKAKMN